MLTNEAQMVLIDEPVGYQVWALKLRRTLHVQLCKDQALYASWRRIEMNIQSNAISLKF